MESLCETFKAQQKKGGVSGRSREISPLLGEFIPLLSIILTLDATIGLGLKFNPTNPNLYYFLFLVPILLSVLF